MKIPFVDLKSQYISIKKELDASMQSVIDETSFIKGKYVKKFEEEYAEAYKMKDCISCANGTDAIYIALKALNIGLGDEVITVSNTWISTAETISQTGAKPVFVDIDEYHNIDVEKIEENITSNTKAIIAVHLYGLPCQITNIISICKKYNLKLIEDCAQSHFAKYNGQLVGTFGDIATFSFFPGKNLGAYGDAGAIITNNHDYADFCRKYANHGSLVKHKHEMEGINSRLDGIQAAILSVKLKYINRWTDQRIENASFYNQLFKSSEYIKIPKVYSEAKHVYHLYVIKCKSRDKLIKYLDLNNISTAIHYPLPLPFLRAYKYLNYNKSDFPISYGCHSDILSLPMFPELSKDQIEYIFHKIMDFFEEK